MLSASYPIKILVTGGGGFLGSALARELKRRGHQVRVLLKKGESGLNLRGLDVEIITGDIRDQAGLAEAVKGIDVIFHTAAILRFFPFYVKHPKEIYEVNVGGTRNLCEAALAAGVKKVIHTSSIAAVEKSHRRSHYEKSKALAEEIALMYHQKGMHVVSVNPGFIFGAGDSGPSPAGELIVRFLNKFYLIYFDAVIHGVDLDTVVEAHIKAMEMGKSGERYIVIGKRPYMLKEIFTILEEITGIKAPRIRIPIGLIYVFSLINELSIGRPVIASEIVKYYMADPAYDGTKARQEFGLKDRPIRETFEKAVNWYVANGYVRKG